MILARARTRPRARPRTRGRRGRLRQLAQRRHQRPHRLYGRGGLEAPVQQGGRLPVHLVVLGLRVHHRDQQGAAVALGDPGVRGPGVRGVAVLHARYPGVRVQVVVAGQQPVGVLDGEGLADLGRLALLVLLVVARELRADRRAVRPEGGVLQPLAGEQRQVVRAADLARLVVTVRRDHMRVVRLQLLGLGVHAGHRRRHAAVHGGQHVHGVVAGAQEHPQPQVLHAVGQVLLYPDQAAALAHPRQVGGQHLVQG
ncbi:MAG: hypothetical protein QOF98_1082, partial [Streptomyces sp.]|nr:hypothetical protein [Streptomyces sp.]